MASGFWKGAEGDARSAKLDVCAEGRNAIGVHVLGLWEELWFNVW